MSQLFSTLKCSISRSENPVDKTQLCDTPGFSLSSLIFQSQLASKPGVLRFSSVFLAITRLLSAGHEKAMSILLQTTIPHLRESELALDDTELMLHLGPDTGPIPVPETLHLGQTPTAAALRVGEVPGPWCEISYGLFLHTVSRITPHAGLFTMAQVGQHLGIMDIGRRRHDGVNELRTTVDTDVRLHPEEPLVALLGRAHVRVALLLLVLGGTRGADDAGVNDSPKEDLQAIFLEILVHQVEELVAQVVLLHQVAELADGGLIRHGLPAEIDADELAQRTGVVEGLFGSRIRQVEPVLDEVDAQHALGADVAPAGTLRIGVERFDDFSQFPPGNSALHFLKELLLTSFFPVLFESGIGKRILAHQIMPLVAVQPIMNQYGN